MASSSPHMTAHSPVPNEAIFGQRGPKTHGVAPTLAETTYQSHFMDNLSAQDSQGSPRSPLEDSQLTLLNISSAEVPFSAEPQPPLPEVKRISRPDTNLDGEEAPYTFGTAPVHSKNQFSGKQAAPLEHFRVQSSNPKPVPEPPRHQDSKWRQPQTSPFLPESNPAEANTGDLAKAAGAVEEVDNDSQVHPPPRGEYKLPYLPPTTERTHARIEGNPPISHIESGRHSREASVIGDLDGPAAAKAKRASHKTHHQTGSSTKRNGPLQEPVQSIEFPLLDAREVSSRPMGISGSHQPHGNEVSSIRAGHQYQDGGHAMTRHSMARKTPAESSPARPPSHVSNVSRRRHLKQKSRYSAVPDTPMQSMQAHMKAIDSERNRLRQERNDALKAYQELQFAVGEADERIAVGKSQLQQLGEDHRAVRLENQNLQAQVEALQTDLAVKNKETADAQIRVAEEQRNSITYRTEEVERFNKLKAKLYAKCDSLQLSLDDIVHQHKSLASKSKQQWDRTLAECQLMNQEIQGNRTAACHLADCVREAHQRSAKIIEQVKDMDQKQGEARSALLSDQLQEAEDQLRRAEEEKNRLRQELEHQQSSNTSLETCKNDIITAMAALQAQFESSQSTQGSDLLTPKLDAMLSLLESSDRESQNSKQVVEGIRGQLEESLSSFATEIHQSTDSLRTLMQEINRIEQTLCCEMKTLRETHSAREAEMRRELANLAEEKAKSTARLEAEKLKSQRFEEMKENCRAEMASFQEKIEEAKAELLSAAQRAETDQGLLRQEVAAKQQKIESLQESSARDTEKHQQELVILNGEVQDLKKAIAAHEQRATSDIDTKKLQESEARALQELQVAHTELVSLKQKSKAETDELQKQLRVSEQRHANLTHKLKAKGILSSPPGSMNEALEHNTTQLDKYMQQLAGIEKYLEKLASEATDVKEMETMFRTLVEIQGVLLATHKLSVRETLDVEAATTSEQQESGVRRFKSAPDSSQPASQEANPVGKQIVFRTPSQDGEEPGVTALAPGRERMQRRMRGPEKSILRQTTGHAGSSQPVADDTVQTPQQAPEPFAILSQGHRAFSRPVEGKPAQSSHTVYPLNRNSAAVQSIKTSLVGSRPNVSQSDALTSLALWKSGAQETATVPPAKRPASAENQQVADRERLRPEMNPEARVSEDAGVSDERPKKRMRTYTGRTRSQEMVDLPPSNQQALTT